MATQLTYIKTDKKYISYVSKGDSICFTQDNKQYNATVVSISPNQTRVRVDQDHYVDVKNDTVSIKEKFNFNGAIPVEVNDLVTYDTEQETGIVVGVDGTKVRIYLVGNKHKYIDVNISDLSYLAKGYVAWVPEEDMRTPSSTLQTNMSARYSGGGNPSGTMHQHEAKNYQGMNQNLYGNTQPVNNQNVDTTRFAPTAALLYPAPCVVMAVPHNTDPNSYPEAMSVHLPWSNSPTLMPVVRMGSGTVLVVVPSASPQVAQVQVNQAQVAQQNQNVQLNPGMQTMNMNSNMSRTQGMNMGGNVNTNVGNTSHYQNTNPNNAMLHNQVNLHGKMQVQGDIKMENSNATYMNPGMKMNPTRTTMVNTQQQPMMNPGQTNPMNQQTNMNTMPNNTNMNNHY